MLNLTQKLGKIYLTSIVGVQYSHYNGIKYMGLYVFNWAISVQVIDRIYS